MGPSPVSSTPMPRPTDGRGGGGGGGGRGGGEGVSLRGVFTFVLGLSWLASSVGGMRFLKENVAYVELTRARMAVYRGPREECSIMGSRDAVRSALSNGGGGGGFQWDVARQLGLGGRVELVSRDQMRAILARCQAVHADLYRADADAFLDVDGGGGGGGDGAAENEVPLERVDNSLAIYKGLEKKRRRERQRNNSIWGWNFFNRILIMPGTKWCGQGDIADHYDDLGHHREVDKCCRNHDLCLTVTGEYLSPGECNNGLCNYSPFTRSPCPCDRKFSQCLHGVKTRVSNALGKMFFNIAGMTCYQYDHPVKHCAEFVEPPRHNLPPWILQATQASQNPEGPRCRRYELDRTRPKTWQFFETVYDESNQRSEVPRSISGRDASYAAQKRPPLSVFHKLLTDFFLKIVDPL